MTSNENRLRIGCAGWTIAKEHSELFPSTGSHLERYTLLFDAVEINATFYRLPKAQTIQNWKNAVPDDFKFAVKLSKEITHIDRLKSPEKLPVFMERVQLLEEKLGPVLIQLPPSLAFDEITATQFFKAFRTYTNAYLVLEPRHLTWFTETAIKVYDDHQVALVAADPAINPLGTIPGAWPGIHYYRLHGSPRMYYSTYSDNYLQELATQINSNLNSQATWVIFDNTASGEAVKNGLFLKSIVK